jgi:4-hydroxybenzoate polyprenyltransferase
MAAFGAVAVLTTVPDMEGDAESGKKTFALIYRVRKTTIIAALLCFISAIGGWITQDRIIFWPAILSSPIFILAVFLQTKEAVILSIKFSILLLSLSVGLRFPWYLVLMGIYFFGARWYYRKRFNIDYPSFKLE